MDSFFTWGLRIGRIQGIEIRLHWTLLLFWLWRLDAVLGQGSQGRNSGMLVAWMAGVGLLFLSVLLHELGHALAARKVGGSVEHIVLWPLGGLASCRCPHHWRAQLLVAAAGPAVTLGVILLSALTFLVADQFVVFSMGEVSTVSRVYDQARTVLILWNIVILVFNVLPVYPLDGGRMLHSTLWGFYSDGLGPSGTGLSRANRITWIVTRVTCLLGIVAAVFWPEQPDLLLVALFVWLLVGAGSLRS